ncbi:rgy1 [Acrasis kona]|uniref:Rgy1 n=1 Tax=Acrasis kona TaxID=1008807 RepID=A0AAW2YUX7_9EUKA
MVKGRSCVVCEAKVLAKGKVYKNVLHDKKNSLPLDRVKFYKWHFRKEAGVSKHIKSGYVCQRHRFTSPDITFSYQIYKALPDEEVVLAITTQEDIKEGATVTDAQSCNTDVNVAVETLLLLRTETSDVN